MGEIRDLLKEDPREVVVWVIEDAISPEDTTNSFEESGLISLVYTYKDGEPWPTLSEMFALGERVLVLAEEGRPPPDRYHHVQD